MIPSLRLLSLELLMFAKKIPIEVDKKISLQNCLCIKMIHVAS